MNEFNQARESRRELSTEYRTLRPDGTVVWVVDRGRAWYDKTGRAIEIGMAGAGGHRNRVSSFSLQTEFGSRFRPKTVGGAVTFGFYREAVG